MNKTSALFLVNFLLDTQERLMDEGICAIDIPPVPLGNGGFIHIKALRDVLMEDSADGADILKHPKEV